MVWLDKLLYFANNKKNELQNIAAQFELASNI